MIMFQPPFNILALEPHQHGTSFPTCSAPSLPSLQDLSFTLSWARKRCRDDKAVVRKAALQLLEALLVLQASWQGRAPVPPSTQDLGLIEAAAADALVSDTGGVRLFGAA